MSFHTFKSPQEIRLVMDAFLALPATFLAEIHDKSKNLTYEGAKPFSAHTDGNGKKTYHLTNSDSNYTRAFATIELDNITKISSLPSMLPKPLLQQLKALERPSPVMGAKLHGLVQSAKKPRSEEMEMT